MNNEKHQQGTHYTQMVADSLAENISAQFVCPSPKFLDLNKKRLHWASVVRDPCHAGQQAVLLLSDVWKKWKCSYGPMWIFFCRGRRWGVEANYAYLIPTWSINSASSRARESKKPTVGQKNIKIMSTPIVQWLFFCL